MLQGVAGRCEIPPSAEAAERLGWPLTRFVRKLDDVGQKLTRSGVRGLHGGPGASASERRARLVDDAVASRLVTLSGFTCSTPRRVGRGCLLRREGHR